MGRSQAQQEHAAEFGAAPEIPEFERKSRHFSAEVSWWTFTTPEEFTARCGTEVKRMMPRQHMVPDIWLYTR